VTSNEERRSVILVVEDVEETRYGIERLLTASGYQVSIARDEEDEVLKTSAVAHDLTSIPRVFGTFLLGLKRNVLLCHHSLVLRPLNR
jgi:CheY-like chemotaxis protein